MKKEDLLRAWLKTKQFVSTTEIKIWSIENFFTSADVRCRKFVRDGELLEAIPTEEALLTGLTKPGHQPVRWYKVIE